MQDDDQAGGQEFAGDLTEQKNPPFRAFRLLRGFHTAAPSAPVAAQLGKIAHRGKNFSGRGALQVRCLQGNLFLVVCCLPARLL